MIAFDYASARFIKSDNGRGADRMTAPMYMAVHEAAHAVIAVTLGGFAEYVTLIPDGQRKGGCAVSWPDDGDDRTEYKLLTAAAGPAATALNRRCGLDAAILETGISDLRYMKALGDTDDKWFAESRKRCRRHWPSILAVARAVQANGVLNEHEILAAMTPLRAPPAEGVHDAGAG